MLWQSHSVVAAGFVVPPDGRRDIIWTLQDFDEQDSTGAVRAHVTETSRSAEEVSAQPNQIWVGARLKPGVLVLHLPSNFDDLLICLPSDDLSQIAARFRIWIAEARFQLPPKYIQTATTLAHCTGGRASAGDLSKAAGVAPRYLLRGFNKYLGLGPKAYLDIMRINRALQLRAQSSISLTQIALECGYADQAHFTRSCRRLMGLAPKDLSNRIILPRLPLI
ncbi:helix-turn-helix transcriptional regulator [uncultured Ruegeria sp.]|uniref:helix-turn-helix transcriptional regulator n=1 Tax=uncultured Ruegeria sp. TaxID=259304 RepID=UPI00262478CC|nr:helix-turn-helix transcriptional regulator [uncultured Ruegeria sp.]